MSDSKEKVHESTQEAQIDLFEILYDFLRGFKKIWWLIPVLVCLFGGLLYARTVIQYQPMYKSQASFTVSTATSSGSSYSYSFYYDSSTVKQMAATFPYILESNLLTDLIKNDLGVEYINGTISASAIADSNLFTLTVTSNDPQDAYDILEAVMNHYSEVSAYVIGDTKLNMIEAPKLAESPYNEENGLHDAVKGAAAGLTFAIIIQFIYGKMRKTIQREDEVKDVLNVQCLGVVPKVIFKKHRISVDQDISLLNKGISNGFRESVRAIALRMDQEFQKQQKKTILITGSVAGEGVSVVSRNLAYALSEMGKRVILINGNLQMKSEKSLNNTPAGQVHQLRQKNESLGAPKYGLEDLLRGKCSLADAVYIDEAGHIICLECRKGMQNKKILTMGADIGKLICQFRQVMDYIVIDAPPCTNMSHAALFAENADAIVYTVKQDQESANSILDCIEEISSYGASFAGCILSQVQENGLAGYGYGKYGKYYGNYRYRRYGYGYRYGSYGYGYGYKENQGKKNVSGAEN